MSSEPRSNSHGSTAAGSTPSHEHSTNMNDKEMSSTAPTPARQPPQLGQETFWSPRLRAQRGGYLKAMGSTIFLIMIFVWAVIAIYWGSVWKEIDLSPNLTAWIVNRDSGAIGAAIQEALLDVNKNGTKPHSTWTLIDPVRYPTQEQLDYEVTNTQSTWMIVTVAEDATAKLEQARANGDASWNPQSLISLTYATSRNFQVVPSMVLAPATATLNKAIARLSAQLAAEYFSTIAGNQTAINNLARAPQTIASPVALHNRDLRPYDVTVAIAVLVVGLIYQVILTLPITMANFGARQGLQPFLRYRSLVAMRIIAPLASYFFLSLMISLLNIPFKVPYGRTFSYGAGFMTWWSATFVGMCVLGLVVECAISLVGPKFIGFTLIFWIIINVSVANLPIELSPSFYKYGYSMPFYSIHQIYTKIIFDVGQRVEILKWFGILWAWLAVILLTFPIWIYLEVRSAQKARQAQTQKQQQQKSQSEASQ
ncbi:hypothetical protein EX895_004146 [Sporisorium graminicola]|uniref:DUF3533 domain-containing protein n=1 Tax=Sporisorium graminicola TaxID=280036 RepID=A0A4U7KU68_9BASI|nr:hypothetical protein EX895_004146 [Sporisorium graminicola]TKY86858.1 hypothetical protein EX895_004146 [Sporisorium graminicola]